MEIKTLRDLYPVTIVQDRYGGCYSGGEYTAWNLYPEEVPEEIAWDDMGCRYFWQDTERERPRSYGIGDTPDAALANLFKNAQEVDCRKPWTYKNI